MSTAKLKTRCCGLLTITLARPDFLRQRLSSGLLVVSSVFGEDYLVYDAV